jgi:cell wall-associated NlpC family hydrolase
MSLRVRTSLLAACLLLPACALPAVASAEEASKTGGISSKDPRFAPTKKAKIVNGVAIPPKGAPQQVVNAIDAANEIVRKPYRYGGGHRRWRDSGYDCSGSVSYALHGTGLLDTPLDSSALASWGERGRGDWVTVRTNPGHAYMIVAGLRFDTSARRAGTTRWTETMRSPRGYVARHPDGL